jgi:hypothetical protein
MTGVVNVPPVPNKVVPAAFEYHLIVAPATEELADNKTAPEPQTFVAELAVTTGFAVTNTFTELNVVELAPQETIHWYQVVAVIFVGE